jgi:anti-sigma factor RsiW
MSSPPQRPAELLPWYLNHTLTPEETRVVEEWLRADPARQEHLSALRQMRQAVATQPQPAPSPKVRAAVLAQVQTHRPRNSIGWRVSWVWSIITAVILLCVLWLVVQPGLVVEWRIQGQGASAFRVYRAPAGSAQFELIREVAARPDQVAYAVTDLSPLPGQVYTYLIEAVTPDGNPIISQSVIGNGLDALPAQLALLLTSLVAGCSLMLLTRLWPSPPIGRRMIGA